MKVRARNILGSVAIGALACSAMVATPAFAADAPNNDDNGISVTAGFTTDRISGVDRFGTAVAASKSFDTEGVRDTVVLANYLAWSDTLAATPLADALNGTVLYSYADRLEAKTAAELDRLKAANGGSLNVLLVGGEGVLNHSISVGLTKKGFTVDRIGGSDRYETALKLAAEAVDHYNGGSLVLSDARESIRGVVHAEAAYQAALVEWNKARAVSDSAFGKAVAAVQNVAAKQKDLNDAIKGVVAVPGAPTQADLNTAAGAAATTRNVANDVRTTEAFVNDVLATYAGHVGTDFQNDTWAKVVAHFGNQQFSYTLTTGVQSGTLAQLSATAPYLSTAAAIDGNDTVVKAVEQNLDQQVTARQAEADAAAQNYADLLAQAADAAEAAATNEAQQKKIVAAQKALEAAQEAADKALEAYDAALAAEAEAKAELLAAANNRPEGDDLSEAQHNYEGVLNNVLKGAKAYPAFLATGTDFADALAAGPAAAEELGVVLLTQGSTLPASTARYLAAGSNQVAVGGPAAAAAPKPSVKYVGADRYETAVKLAKAYFGPADYDYVGLASGTVAADAVVAGALLANVDGTLVLTRPNELPKVTENFLSYDVDGPIVVGFGGPGAISNGVMKDVEQALKN